MCSIIYDGGGGGGGGGLEKTCFSMDWYGCFIYKTHNEIFSITLYGTVCPLYRLLPLPHAWGNSDHKLHYKPHLVTLHHSTIP